MKGHGTKFSNKMGEAVAALLTQRNFEEAAKAVGISPATLLRWQKKPEFQAALREARRVALSQAIGRLQQGTSAAATTFLKIMVDPESPASTKIRAAECVFNFSIKAIELELVEARVTELENRIKGEKSFGRDE